MMQSKLKDWKNEHARMRKFTQILTNILMAADPHLNFN